MQIFKSLYGTLKATGFFSWILITIGKRWGVDARRYYLVKLQIISQASKQLLDDIEAQAASIPRLSAVQRLECVNQEEFQEDYANRGKPVILRGLVSQNQVQHWSWENLKRHHGDLMLLVRKGSDYDRMKRFRISLTDYIDSMLSGEQAFYLGNNLLPKIMYDMVNIPEVLTRCNQFSHERAQLWIGGQSTGAHLHRDLFDNIVFLYQGSKTFYLAAPDESQWLYIWEVHSTLNSSKFNFLAPDYRRFPLARNAHFISVTMQPGDILYIPCGWFHQVVNNHPSSSVSIFGQRLGAAALISLNPISQPILSSLPLQ
ncbi:cupin-like domain-containing protein [Leptothoe sp. EHU-05/26/07-4]